MKKITFFFSLLCIYACSNDVQENNKLTNNLVELEFITTEPNFDEIMVSYSKDKLKTTFLNSYTFSYDLDGNPLPLKITLENYDSTFISGEAFRENHSPAELSVKLYVNGQLIIEDSSKGTAETIATVYFNHTISN